jgi:ArsR family transcriptional regulator, arsenate/arsenite/antimonite-responsive transcriptional repressor
LSKYRIGFRINKNMNDVFKALNDPIRRDILTLLREKDRTAGEIADAFSVGKPTISHHLDLLRQANLVESVKNGQFVVYSLNTTVLDEIMKWFLELKS